MFGLQGILRDYSIGTLTLSETLRQGQSYWHEGEGASHMAGSLRVREMLKRTEKTLTANPLFLLL